MSKLKNILEELIPYVVIVIFVVLIRTFIATPVRVDGDSMNPTLENKELLLLQKFSTNYNRFDIVVFRYNNDKLVKRVIGLPGDYIEYKDDKLYVNGEVIEENYIHKKTSDFKLEDFGYNKIPEGKYFVLGDNRTNSLDSRYIGLIDESDIEGIVKISIFPPKKI